MKAKFQQNLKNCRVAMGLTQKQAAETFNITVGHWQKYESGERTPTFDGLIEMADYFGVSIDSLIGRETKAGDALANMPKMNMPKMNKREAKILSDMFEKALQLLRENHI